MCISIHSASQVSQGIVINSCLPQEVQTVCPFRAQSAAFQSSRVCRPPAASELSQPVSISTNQFGDRFVLDRIRSALYRWEYDNTWTVYAGIPGKQGLADGVGTQALMNFPEDHVADSYGNIFVADTANHCIRVISQGVVSTFAGTSIPGYKDDDDGAQARFTLPRALAVDSVGNLYVAEEWRLRKVRLPLRSGGGCKGLACPHHLFLVDVKMSLCG